MDIDTMDTVDYIESRRQDKFQNEEILEQSFLEGRIIVNNEEFFLEDITEDLKILLDY